MASIDICPAKLADSDAIAVLVTELGYPTLPSQMRSRLESIFADEQYSTLVASEGERVLGFIGTRLGLLYESNALYGQIMAMAVATDHRRNGIGQRLLQAAESMLIRRGARVLVLGTGNHRGDAHSFYEKNGYAFTGRRYKKFL